MKHRKKAMKHSIPYTEGYSVLSTKQNPSSDIDAWKILVLMMEQMHQGCPVLGLSAFSSFLWKTSSCFFINRRTMLQHICIRCDVCFVSYNKEKPIGAN